MIFIEFLSRWLAKAAVDSQLEELSKARDNTGAFAGLEPGKKEPVPPELRMDDSPPGYKIRWWI